MENKITILKNHVIGIPHDKRLEILNEIDNLSEPDVDYLLNLINKLNECGLEHKFDHIKSTSEGLSYSAKHAVYSFR